MKQTLRETVLSETNIYNAIYAVDSYISEKNLLSKADMVKLNMLRDKFDFKGIISKTVKRCKERLKHILDKREELFEVKVYFKIKKLSKEPSYKVEYRPLHTASLTDQICMAALLMPLMFDDSSGKRQLSELSQMLPHNFFGNIPSCDVGNIFCNWQEKYREYTETVNGRCRDYAKTREYDREICFDLKDFFPSIDPKKILDFITAKLGPKYKTDDDKATLRTILTKLLYFRIPEDNLNGWYEDYYKGKFHGKPINGFYPNRGIAQGLPQSYFFGNLCMIDVAEKITNKGEMGETDSYFYVDDSVVFARNIDIAAFKKKVANLNKLLEGEVKEDKKADDTVHSKKKVVSDNPELGDSCLKLAEEIEYNVKLHEDTKSSICDIEDSFTGMEGLFYVQRTVSMGGWIKGNLDEVDDNVALKKLKSLIELVDREIKHASNGNALDGHQNKQERNESRLKWLKRYRRYFLFREKQLQILLQGEFDLKMTEDFYRRFKFKEVEGPLRLSNFELDTLFESLDEEIFQSEFELLLGNMPFTERTVFCERVQCYDDNIASIGREKQVNKCYLYYHRVARSLSDLVLRTIDPYASLEVIVRRTGAFYSPEKFIESIRVGEFNGEEWKRLREPFLEEIDGKMEVDLITEFPDWCRFVLNNSEDFKRRILNCYFSYSCNIPPSDDLSILRRDIKPVRYFELRILSMLRNHRFNFKEFMSFLQKLEYEDLFERMEIDLGILETIGIMRQRVHDPDKIDRLIQTHRIVKSLWHNGSKFLNAYTLHNHEHAGKLIKNVVRIINNIDFLNLKSMDYFLLFTACYLHDISMVIHPAIPSFNEGNHNAESLISNWMERFAELNTEINTVGMDKTGESLVGSINRIRKKTGLVLVQVFSDIFYFFESKMRAGHPEDSAQYVRLWQGSTLKFLTELEADIVATVSESHGWDSVEVYNRRSNAKDELVSLKYMMILIRLADLLDLANDRIDYYILKQNWLHMNRTSRYHWISHLIIDKYELDVDYEVREKCRLSEKPLVEKIHLDIFVNTEIMASIEAQGNACEGVCPKVVSRMLDRVGEKKDSRECIEYELGRFDEECSSELMEVHEKGRRCPFLCMWMTDKHKWLFNEFGKLKNYLNAVNSPLITSDIVVRVCYDNKQTLDTEFYDDVKEYLSKS